MAQTTVSNDHLNRPSTVNAASPYGTTTYTYFLDGAVNTIADANGTTTFTEDRLGRVATMVTPLIAGTTSYVYDAVGRLTSRTEANGIVTTVTYTGTDQLASKTEVAGGTTLASWTSVSYDLAQNRTAETLTYYAGNPYPDAQAGTSTYKYDTEDQFSQASLPGKAAATFGFDAAHNLTSNAGTTQTFNSNESLQTFGAATTGSDADGNQLKDVVGNTLGWNSLSQLERFSTTETYTYDALGRLTTVTNGANVTKFVYLGLSGRVIQELDSSNAVLRSYAWDGDRQLYAKVGANAYYQITNPHGDVVALANATALVGTQHFDPWGILTYTPSGTTTPFGFQGAMGSWTNATSGFVIMGIRWYYPNTSQFLSSDPAAGTAAPRTPINRARWLYALNDPVDHADPTGLIGVCDCQDSAGNTGNPTKKAKKPQQPVSCGGRHGCPKAPAASCNIGRQSCGTFAQHFGTQLLNVACGVTICPVVQGVQETHQLITDPTGWWKEQTDRWNAEKAYWSDVNDTYQKARNAPLGWVPGVAEFYFGLKWTADRLEDFDRDPGTSSANIVVFFGTAALPAPKFVRAAPETRIAVRPSIDTAGFSGRDKTANGGIRNPGQFWKQWARQFPDTLSADNIETIKKGRSPHVDEVWTSVYPEDAPYMEDVLEHHHIDQGRWATPLPGTVHKEARADLHSRRGGAQIL